MDTEKTSSAKILCDLIRDAERIVFLGGAGVSTESGIPDFRGSGGLYTEAASIPPVPTSAPSAPPWARQQ